MNDVRQDKENGKSRGARDRQSAAGKVFRAIGPADFNQERGAIIKKKFRRRLKVKKGEAPIFPGRETRFEGGWSIYD